MINSVKGGKKWSSKRNWASSRANLNLKMDTVAFREWYKNPLTSKNNYISEVYVPLGSDSPCVTISVPIIHNGQVVGVLGADLELSEIQ